MELRKYVARLYTACSTVGLRRSSRLRRRTFRKGLSSSAGISAWLASERLEQRQLLTAEISIANAAAAVVEGQTASFIVTLDAAASETVSVVYSTTDGEGPTAATNGVDFTAISNQTLTFSPGQTQRTITIPTINDSIVEETKTLEVILSSPEQATLAVSRAFGTILDNDTALPVLSISDAPIVTEGETAVFQVTLSAPASGPVTLLYDTVLYDTVQKDEPTAATSGIDYVAHTGQMLTFAAGETQKTIRIATIDDTTVENTETFRVLIRNPSGAVSRAARAWEPSQPVTFYLMNLRYRARSVPLSNRAPCFAGQLSPELCLTIWN